MKRIYKFLTMMLFLSLILASCSEDFLETPPIGKLNITNVATAEGIQLALNGAYAAVAGAGPTSMTGPPLNATSGTLRGGEAHRGYLPGDRDWEEWNTYNISLVNEGNNGGGPFPGLLGGLYNAVYQCNLVLQLVDASTELSDTEKDKYRADARFLRGHFYFWLWANYRNIPWIDENTDDVRVPNTDENGNYVDNFDKILADFDFARKNLDETRDVFSYANKWAAEVYYAKALLFRGNYKELDGGNGDTEYNEALDVLDDVIASGVTASGEPYALQENYKWNFDPRHKNSSESIFAQQSGMNENYTGITNGAVSFLFYPGFISQGWSYDLAQPTQWYVDHYRVDPVDNLPYLDMYDTYDYKLPDGSESDVADNEYVTDQVTPVDPRLDINVGRRGVDHNGWGRQPKTAWITAPTYYGYYREKKYIVDPVTYDEYTMPNKAVDMNLDILRYNDVLLMAAELEARVGDVDIAMGYVNDIRSRVLTSTDAWAMELDIDGNYTGNYAANYNIGLYPDGHAAFSSRSNALDAILYERTLELGLEGYRFFDLVRFGKDVEEIPVYLTEEIAQGREYLSKADYPVGDPYKRLLPIPINALQNSLKDGVETLTQNPGY